MSHYTIPTVLERTPAGERSFDIFSRLIRERIVFLGTEITDDSANLVIAQLLFLASEAPGEDIELCINSPGGSFTALMAIVDTIGYIASDVATVGIGQAASAAAVLLAAGTRGKRRLLPHARLLLHQPSGQSRGTLADLSLHARELSRVRADIDQLLSQCTGQGTERLREDTQRDKIFNAQEAVAYGLADDIVTAQRRP